MVLACTVLIATVLGPSSGASAVQPAFRGTWGDALTVAEIESSPLFAKSLDETIVRLESDVSEAAAEDRFAAKTAAKPDETPPAPQPSQYTTDYSCGATCSTTCGYSCYGTCGSTCS